MQNIAGHVPLARRERGEKGNRRLSGERLGGEQLSPGFIIPFLSFCVLAACVIGWKPLQLSILTIFLFAGPHNWMEFRYFLSRMPARWGKSKSFYSVGLGGVALLAGLYVLLYALGQSWYLNEMTWTLGISCWNTLLILWVCALVRLRAGQGRGRNWSWVFAAGFALCAVAWLWPLYFSLGLVYLHPLVALWFLDRQLKSTRPRWRKSYRLCLALLPLLLCLMWARGAGAGDLPDADGLSWRITQHAGAGILTNISSRTLVATHVFLETIHYSVWLVLIPLAGLGSSVWRMKRIPLAVARNGWPRTVRAALLLGIFVVLVLWCGFAVDYQTTRDLYFTFAMAHVLAEAPFLIRLL